MELIGTIEKKFAVDGDTMKVVVTLPASKDNVDFINQVKGMRCDIYVDARAPEPEAPEAEDDGSQHDMFADAPDAESSVGTGVGGHGEPLANDAPWKCAHDLPAGKCGICASVDDTAGFPAHMSDDEMHALSQAQGNAAAGAPATS